MKTAVVALSCLTSIVVSFAAGAAGGSKSATPTSGPHSVGVIRIVEVLQVLSKDKKHGETIAVDRSRARSELETLAKEIEAAENEIRTLKPDSRDYASQFEIVTEKKAHYSARKEFLDRQMVVKQQLWTQKTYTQIVQTTQEVAVEKGLSLVLAKDDLVTTQPEAVPAMITTQKMIYSGGCPDITKDVLARLTAAKP
ncbi:MAG: OmpH family outer membrane protein [Planctomycetes bacterium]|jgi:Skp family chaperone for outer membrane proteins|nr:OmpH family outer membrane protein [Planctomycetota bacterium]